MYICRHFIAKTVDIQIGLYNDDSHGISEALAS